MTRKMRLVFGSAIATILIMGGGLLSGRGGVRSE
jgi:hypothetical protein